MERNDYLKLAQRANMLPRGARDFRPNCPDELRVIFAGGEYYPLSLRIWFMPDGTPKHSAELVDCKSATMVTAPLEKVERKAVSE